MLPRATYDTTSDVAVTQYTARKAKLTIHCISFFVLTDFCDVLFPTPPYPPFVYAGIFFALITAEHFS